jgi:hypothetical protein
MQTSPQFARQKTLAGPSSSSWDFPSLQTRRDVAGHNGKFVAVYRMGRHLTERKRE